MKIFSRVRGCILQWVLACSQSIFTDHHGFATMGSSVPFFSCPFLNYLLLWRRRGAPMFWGPRCGGGDEHLPANSTSLHPPFHSKAESIGLHLVLHRTLGINSLKAQVYHRLDGYWFFLLNQCFPRAEFYLFIKPEWCPTGVTGVSSVARSFCETQRSETRGEGTSWAWERTSAVMLPRGTGQVHTGAPPSPPLREPFFKRTCVRWTASWNLRLDRSKAAVSKPVGSLPKHTLAPLTGPLWLCLMMQSVQSAGFSTQGACSLWRASFSLGCFVLY